jgi:regulator of protease activity HflC (stomatin/prohibitin superfamily)
VNSHSIIAIVVVSGLVMLAFAKWPVTFDVPEGFYGLLYRHGRSLHRISPGRHWFWARGYTVRLVDMRKITLDIAAQHVLSADNVPLKVNAVLTYQIIQAETALHDVHDFAAHLAASVQLAVRSVISATPIEELLHQRFEIGKQLIARVEPDADHIGIIIHALEIKEIALRGELHNVHAGNKLVP